MDDDDASVFARTVDWAVARASRRRPSTSSRPTRAPRLHQRLAGRGPHHELATGTCYDTRHAVFRPARMTRRSSSRPATGAPTATSTAGGPSSRAAWAQPGARERLRHLAYTAGWKKLEPMWDVAIRSGQVRRFLPLLETDPERLRRAGRRERGRRAALPRATPGRKDRRSASARENRRRLRLRLPSP